MEETKRMAYLRREQEAVDRSQPLLLVALEGILEDNDAAGGELIETDRLAQCRAVIASARVGE